MTEIKRRSIDLLIEQFWKQGYLTVSRKYGTYLPEPDKVGDFEVDIVARYKAGKYAIGITLSCEELNDPHLEDKIVYLATRHTRSNNNRVTLFIGVPEAGLKNLKTLLEGIDGEIRKFIKVIVIEERRNILVRRGRGDQRVLFS
jgi:hypothetical protein